MFLKTNLTKIRPWNNSTSKKAEIFFPKNEKKLIQLIKINETKNKNYLIKTGECSYEGKSMPVNTGDYVISLKNFNKIISINRSKQTITVQCGVIIADFLKKMKSKNISLYSIPGGINISIGGAISANAIGKDSNEKNSSFGDSVVSLVVLDIDQKIRKISKKNDINRYIGSFGMNGIMLSAELKYKKISSPNITLKINKLHTLKEIKEAFRSDVEYQYLQIDPFFRKKYFAILFNGYQLKNNKKLYKKKKIRAPYFLLIGVKFFSFFSFFLNNFLWGFFYKIFYILNTKIMKDIDIHNFFYPNFLKEIVPKFFNGGIFEYEILITKNFEKIMNNIILFIREKKYSISYVVVKKIYKSKNNFFYRFNDKTGFSVAIAFTNNTTEDKKQIDKFFKNLKLNINATKNDRVIIKNIKKNNLFMSQYKKTIESLNEIPR